MGSATEFVALGGRFLGSDGGSCFAGAGTRRVGCRASSICLYDAADRVLGAVVLVMSHRDSRELDPVVHVSESWVGGDTESPAVSWFASPSHFAVEGRVAGAILMGWL